MPATLSILIVACDPYLAGIYGHKFELDHWQVEIAENFAEAKRLATKSRPAIILLEDGCVDDVAEEIKKVKALPTLLKTKIVVLSAQADREKIVQAKEAGAADYLIYGHFVPQEAVEKMRKLLGV